jgi:hypothetical protein
MQAARKWQGLATAGSILALLGGLAAITPASVAAATVHKCANKTLTLELSTGEGGVRDYPAPIKAITTQGISCAGAYKFFNAFYHNHTQVEPEHFTCKTGKFKAPAGLVPQVCTKPGVKIQFAVQGG